MSQSFRFSEHQRINEYLRIRTMKAKSKIAPRHSNQLSNFPIGLIIITNDGLPLDYKIEFINLYACRLFKVKEDIDINILKQKFSEYIKLKNNYTTKSCQSLNDIIFNTTSYNLEMDNFIPFENSHSKTSILYIKINDFDNDKYIVIDKYERYFDEKRYIEFNLIKTINYQYLHTLYHELNNPLNALLALSGETNKFEQTEINGSKIYDKLSILQKNSLKKKRKKDKKTGTHLALNNTKNKLGFKDMMDDNKSRRRSVGDLEFGLNNKIPLLVNIIKVFIKNFILYLKIRADSLLQLKNEFELQNDTSDLMNAVEVSEYEKELTKNKCVKINLEYIFELYLQKYLCLFQYKEIEYDTFFEKLSDLYVITDEFNFSYYIRQIYTYLYYVVPKKDGFYFEYSKEDNNLKIMIKKKSRDNLSKITDIYKITKEEGYIFKMEQAIQTKEMTKEVLYAMSKKLKFAIEIFDCENLEQNNYLYITIPIEKNERSEFEDFKDEEINEMIDKDAIILEEKLRRQLPNNNMNNESFLEKKVSNISSQLMDILSKSGEELRWSNDSISSIHKFHIQNNNLKNTCVNLPNNSEKNNIILAESQNKMSSIKKNNSSNSLLSKCLKIYEPRKSKFKNNTILEKDKISLKNMDENNSNQILRNRASIKSLNVSEKEKNDKTLNSEKKSKNSQSQKSNGIFTLINKNGKTKKIDMADNNNMSEIPDLTKNQKDQVTVTFKEQSGFYSGYASSIKAKIISDNKSINNKLNNENICSGTQNSTSLISGLIGKRNPSKVKSSLFVSEINGGDKDDKSKSLEKNGYILIELEKDKNNSVFKKMNKNITNKLFLHPIEEENEKKIQVSQKSLDKNTKNNYSENTQNEKNNKTLIDNDINENESLFFKAIKERKIHMDKTNKKNNKLINFSQSSDQKSPIKMQNSVEDSIDDSDYFFHSEEEECNCADLLVVDDEKFNVIASQRILQNLGFESDAAYNGEECINLINKKLKSKCKCNRLYYKIIFLDIVMPIMDGIKAANEIQNMIDKKILNNETKIIFISGNINDPKLKNSLLEIGCVKECLQKPVQISKYQMILEKYYN